MKWMTFEEFCQDAPRIKQQTDESFRPRSSIDYLTDYTREERYLMNVHRSKMLDKLQEQYDKNSSNNPTQENYPHDYETMLDSTATAEI